MACLRFYHHFMLSFKKTQTKAVLYLLVYFSEVELVKVFWKPASHPGSSSDIWKNVLNHHRREKTIWNKNPFNPLVQHWRSGLGGAWSGLGALCVHAIARDIEQAGKNTLQQIPALIEQFDQALLENLPRYWPKTSLQPEGSPAPRSSANAPLSVKFFLLVDHQVAQKMNEEQIQSNNARHVIGWGADWRIGPWTSGRTLL